MTGTVAMLSGEAHSESHNVSISLNFTQGEGSELYLGCEI